MPVTDETRINISKAVECVGQLVVHQNLYKRTRGSHAAVLFDSQLDVMAFAEDVGRHNSLDKTIGKVFMGGNLAKARLAVLSSRISYERQPGPTCPSWSAYHVPRLWPLNWVRV